MKKRVYYQTDVVAELSAYYEAQPGCNPMYIGLAGLSKAEAILQRENRLTDLIEFYGKVCAVAATPAEVSGIKIRNEARQHNETVLYERFRDLLERAIKPSCPECDN